MRRVALPLLFLPFLLTACGEATPDEAEEVVGELPDTEGPPEEAEGCVTLIYVAMDEAKTFYYQKLTPCLEEGAINQPDAMDTRVPFQEVVAEKAGLESPAAVEVLDMKYDNDMEAQGLVILYQDVKEFEVVEVAP